MRKLHLYPSVIQSNRLPSIRTVLLPLCLAVLGSAAFAMNQPAPVAKVDRPVFGADTGFTYGAWRSSVVGGGGYIQNVVPCPTNPNRFYTYVDVGGVCRSDDGGLTWRMLHGHLPPTPGNYQVRGLSVDPRDDKKIIICTGIGGGAKDGIYVSDDAGETWKKTLTAQFCGNGASRTAGFIIARNPQNPDVLVAASMGDGVWKSADNGLTWQESGASDLAICDIKYDRANPKRLWLCAGGEKLRGKEFSLGFFRSDDGGATWTKLTDTTPSEIVQDPKDEKTIYGLFRSEIIKRSQDGGVTWEDFSDGLEIKIEPGVSKPSVSTSAYRALAAGPDFILTASTSNATFYKLKCGESKWQRIEKEKIDTGTWYGPQKGNWYFGGALSSITVDPHDANHWFFTDYFAVYQTHDAGKSWRVTIDGLEVTVSHCLTQDPSDPAIVHLGHADVGPFSSLDGGKRFDRQQVPDGPEKDMLSGGKNMKCITLSPKDPNLLYSVGDKSYFGGWHINQVFSSTDRGQTWYRSPMTGLPCSKDAWCTSIVADLNDARTVYVTFSGKIGPGAGGVYKSTDGGKAWSWMGEGLPADAPFFVPDVWRHGRQLASSWDGSLIAITTKGNLIYRFDPNTQKWTDAGLAHGGKLWSVVPDWFRSGRYYVGVYDDGIYQTDDSGLTWKKIYDKGASFVAADNAVSGRIAAGTADGVVLSTDAGATWKELDKELPFRHHNIPCFVGERLLVGSDGSGVFWIPLSPAGEKDVTAKPFSK